MIFVLSLLLGTKIQAQEERERRIGGIYLVRISSRHLPLESKDSNLSLFTKVCCRVRTLEGKDQRDLLSFFSLSLFTFFLKISPSLFFFLFKNFSKSFFLFSFYKSFTFFFFLYFFYFFLIFSFLISSCYFALIFFFFNFSKSFNFFINFLCLIFSKSFSLSIQIFFIFHLFSRSLFLALHPWGQFALS